MKPVADSAFPGPSGPVTEALQPPDRTARIHLEFIDGVRALAALFVVLGHAYYEPTAGYYTTRWLTRIGLTYGHLAVVVFIVVSGFCLMLPAAQRSDNLGDLRQFFQRRVRRIFPAYYAALTLSALFILLVAHEKTGTIWDYTLPLTWQRFLVNALMLHNLSLPVPGGNINYPLWSIAIEFQIYLVMPLLVLSFRHRGNGFTLFWAIGFGLALCWLFPEPGERLVPSRGIMRATPWFLGLFAMGACAARQAVRREGSVPARQILGPGLLWGVALLVLFGGGKARFDRYQPYYDLLFGAATAWLLYVLFTDEGERRLRLSRWLSWRPLTTIGLFSYSLYLIHAPLLHAAYLIYRPLFRVRPEGMFVLLLLTVPLIVGAAYLFYLCFERPFLRKRL
ncbi:MAG: acyltransferase [Chloroherpetonaceae bacterium]|nr:acyltransferase [Chthonomonadaceae bacterium]MDW8206678.1 acyltransferase [Chloroherpetonaceae bacterium]